jgi:ribosomal protein S18 acetylase RimI-like enzyme
MHDTNDGIIDPLTLVEATAADLPALLSVLHAAYAEYMGKLDPPSGAHKETSESLGTKLETAQAIKAVVGQTIVGCVFFQHEEESLYFSRLAVLPTYRRHGIGQSLVEFVESYARQHKLARITLGVRLAIPANIAYYTKLGYHIVGYGSHPGYTEFTSAGMEKVIS